MSSNAPTPRSWTASSRLQAVNEQRIPLNRKPTVEQPDFETMQEWLFDYGECEATDGCYVEPDGHCEHGYPSWLVHLGLI